MKVLALLLLSLLLSACSGDAVVFAPTPAPADISPTRYTHPAGVFQLTAPRNWAVYEINTTTLAAATFARPNSAEPTLSAAVINLGSMLDSAAFGSLIDRYQTQIRPDAETYREISREAMGDGSWRMTGYRRLVDGSRLPVNTFLQQQAGRLIVLDMLVPDGPAAQRELQQVVNSFAVAADASLEPTAVETLSSVKPTGLGVLHVYGWETADGVFFISGEVANYSAQPIAEVPVRALVRSADGRIVADATDRVMGHAVAPGGFAPFSIRFGQGRPPEAETFDVQLGSDAWQPTSAALAPEGQLQDSSSSSFDAGGRFIVQGSVTNLGPGTVTHPRAILTVFDAQQNVIAAVFSDLSAETLQEGQSLSFELTLNELGGEPVQYDLVVQGLQS